jgi:hypothetical protein
MGLKIEKSTTRIYKTESAERVVQEPGMDQIHIRRSTFNSFEVRGLIKELQLLLAQEDFEE